MQFVVHSNNVSSLHSRFVVRCIRPILFICLHFQWFICHLKFNEDDEMMGTDQTYLATAAKIDWQDMTIEAKTADRTQQREIGKKTSWERESWQSSDQTCIVHSEYMLPSFVCIVASGRMRSHVHNIHHIHDDDYKFVIMTDRSIFNHNVKIVCCALPFFGGGYMRSGCSSTILYAEKNDNFTSSVLPVYNVIRMYRFAHVNKWKSMWFLMEYMPFSIVDMNHLIKYTKLLLDIINTQYMPWRYG